MPGKLILKARDLMRPCVRLRKIRGADLAPVAVYHDQTQDIPGAHLQHQLTLRCDIIPTHIERIAREGVMTVFTSTRDPKAGECRFQAARTLDPQGGTPLYYESSTAYPSPELLYGIFESQDDDEGLELFDDEVEVEEYRSFFKQHDPLGSSSKDVIAIVGGWPIAIFEGDWDNWNGWEWVLITLDQEPFVEVSVDTDNRISVRQLIT